MADNDKIFVILDPTTMEQPSLVAGGVDRPGTFGPVATTRPHCTFTAASIANRSAIATTRTRRTNSSAHGSSGIVAQPRAEGLEVDTEVEISDDWRKSIVAALGTPEQCACDKEHVATPSLHAIVSRHVGLADAGAIASCPVYLVKTSPTRQVRKVLAAIKHRTEKKVYTDANNIILNTARGIAEGLGAELHVVTAYANNFNYPDRQKFADRCGLPRNQVRAELGTPQDAIATAAQEIGADLVVIARVGEPGRQSVMWVIRRRKSSISSTRTLLVLPMTAD